MGRQPLIVAVRPRPRPAGDPVQKVEDERELGFVVAVGILLDTLIVRSILVPALTLDAGRRVWWPGRLVRADAREVVARTPDAATVAEGRVL